jgi:hypothetical protein
MPTTKLRIVSWNLRRRSSPSLLKLLDQQDAHLALLQEVTADAFDSLRDRFAWGQYSLDLWDGRTHEYSTHNHGVAVLGSPKLAPRRAYLLNYVVVPWKVLMVDIALTRQRGYFTATSYHALHGDQGLDRMDKPRLTLQVADWLEHQPQPVVLGMDANSPWVDPPNLADTQCHFQWLGPGDFERRLLGPNARHRLRDTLRTFMDEHPVEYSRLCQERPRGPLAVSHKTRGPQGQYRYDHIYASWPDFRVINVRYLYDEAREAGSDHALVVADLAADTGTGQRGEIDNLEPTTLFRTSGGIAASTPQREAERT